MGPLRLAKHITFERLSARRAAKCFSENSTGRAPIIRRCAPDFLCTAKAPYLTDAWPQSKVDNVGSDQPREARTITCTGPLKGRIKKTF